ncbi:MAG TPA: CYCXC family (seleno)protein, partial [Candidatus Binataceae bacterium]
MLSGSKGVLAVIGGAAFITSVGYFALAGNRAITPAVSTVADSSSGAQCCRHDPARQLRLTLDPNLFKGEVKQAYQVAERDPALLAQMHCYCGCDRIQGHKNLLDCFRDTHGSTCAICVGEAREADTLAKQGLPVDQIRDAL